MGLFGPLDSLNYAGAPPASSPWMYRLDSDVTGYTFPPGLPRPIPIPNSSTVPSYPPATGTGTASGNAGAPAATAPVEPPVPQMPSMQALGTFTTRRTQLFGPLGSVSI